VIEHIKNDELALSELARVLKVGGKLILTVPYNSKDNKRNYKKFQHEKPGYTPEDIARTINELNLDLSIRRIEFYSYKIADRISNLSYKIRSNIIAAIIFYPLYALALLGDCFIKSKEPNGMLLVLEKN
jgi:ubiquinone/menaquinone biosynthesis C-methylase UbiE